MALKITLLFLSLVALVLLGRWILRRQVTSYNALTWSLVEFFWYMISFIAVCIGLVEIDRIERLNQFAQKEKQLTDQYQNVKGLIYAQTRLLSKDKSNDKGKREGEAWFLKMHSLLEDGLYAHRWETFLKYTRSYVFKEPGFYADPRVNQQEFNWPSDPALNTEKLYLRDEISWMVDNIKELQKQKDRVLSSKPSENTNYIVRYVLICLYLLGLSLKILKIYADYRRIRVNR
jgi:hypothetical protein